MRDSSSSEITKLLHSIANCDSDEYKTPRESRLVDLFSSLFFPSPFTKQDLNFRVDRASSSETCEMGKRARSAADPPALAASTLEPSGPSDGDHNNTASTSADLAPQSHASTSADAEAERAAKKARKREKQLKRMMQQVSASPRSRVRSQTRLIEIVWIARISRRWTSQARPREVTPTRLPTCKSNRKHLSLSSKLNPRRNQKRKRNEKTSNLESM